MLALFVVLCLSEPPGACVERMIPGPCDGARAEAWAAQRPGVRLQGWTCAPLAERRAPLPVTEVAPGLFVHRGRHELPSPENAGDQANVGFIVGAGAVAVIDAGGSRPVGERLYAAIRAHTDLPVAWLILTHMHPDHVFGASVFAEAGARVIGHANLPAGLAARAGSYVETLWRATGAEVAIASDILLPDETVAATREIDLGGRRLLLEAHPVAHTDNDLSVLDLQTGIWWLGDLLFHEHLPTIDGSLLGWRSLLADLTQRPVAQVVPGHGGPLLPWPEAAGPMLAYLDGLTGAARAALARGESLSEALPHLGRPLRGDWALFDLLHPRNATVAYLELEWE